MDIIRTHYLKLPPIVHLLYGALGLVHHSWEDGSWRDIRMLGDVNQGCPLSAIFSVLVLDRFLRILDARTNDQLLNDDLGDDCAAQLTLIR